MYHQVKLCFISFIILSVNAAEKTLKNDLRKVKRGAFSLSGAGFGGLDQFALLAAQHGAYPGYGSPGILGGAHGLLGGGLGGGLGGVAAMHGGLFADNIPLGSHQGIDLFSSGINPAAAYFGGFGGGYNSPAGLINLGPRGLIGGYGGLGASPLAALNLPSYSSKYMGALDLSSLKSSFPSDSKLSSYSDYSTSDIKPTLPTVSDSIKAPINVQNSASYNEPSSNVAPANSVYTSAANLAANNYNTAANNYNSAANNYNAAASAYKTASGSYGVAPANGYSSSGSNNNNNSPTNSYSSPSNSYNSASNYNTHSSSGANSNYNTPSNSYTPSSANNNYNSPSNSYSAAASSNYNNPSNSYSSALNSNSYNAPSSSYNRAPNSYSNTPNSNVYSNIPAPYSTPESTKISGNTYIISANPSAAPKLTYTAGTGMTAAVATAVAPSDPSSGKLSTYAAAPSQYQQARLLSIYGTAFPPYKSSYLP